MTTAIVFKL